MFLRIRNQVVGSLLLLSLAFYTAPTKAVNNPAIQYPQARFVVLSDLHYFDPSLGTTGAAFQAYLDRDRKLLAESSELFDAALDEIKSQQADFVIISGDLTKDGERFNHKILSTKLMALKQSGKKVYVVPGNHDIANGDSVRFVGDKTEAIPSISAAEFAEIYHEFGFQDAIEKDANSLSYLAEPIPGLWLLALDSCRWRENIPDHHPITAGVIYDETLEWIDTILEKARSAHKAVIVTLHHGIMEHYPYNEKYYPEYLLDNYNTVAEKLSHGGVKLVFTGHFHAQDITRKTVAESGNTIFDIETGSLVTAPCPYRVIELTEDQKAVIQSRFITAIPSHPTGFQEYADNYVFEGTKKLADEKLIGYRVSAEDRKSINPQASRAYSAHLAGDEVKPEQLINYEDVGIWGKFILFMQKKLIEGWYSDLPPQDNALTINLQN